MNTKWVLVEGIVQKGHQVASGLAKDSPYSQGTIEMQIPFFQQLGIDLNSFFLGTLNISIYPQTVTIARPEYTFRNVKWHQDYPAEDFSFSACEVIFAGNNYPGWIYYPHPATKIGHFQDSATIEVIIPYISGINYGTKVELKVNCQAFSIE